MEENTTIHGSPSPNGHYNLSGSPSGPHGKTLGSPENLFHILWRHSWIIIITVILAIIGGLIYIAQATPIFVSTSRIYVEQSGPKIIQDMEKGVFTGSKNYLYTQAELITATPILSDATKKCEAHKLHTFEDVDNIIGYLKKNLMASVGKKDDILSLSMRSPYPTEAAHIVNTVVDSYITFHANRKRSTSSEVLKILQKEKTKRTEELSDKLHTLMEFKKAHETLAFQTGSDNIILERMQVLSSELTQAELYTLEAKSMLDTARQMMNDPATMIHYIKAHRISNQGIGMDPELSHLKAEMKILTQRRSDRLRELTEDHPAVLALDIEMERIQQQIQDLERDYAQAQLAAIEQMYLTAAEKEEQLRQHYQKQQEKVISLNEQLAQYTLLESEYQQTKRLCDILDERIKELNVTEDVGALNITILEVAQPARLASEPQKGRLMAMAVVLGLMAGGALALLRDMMDHCVRDIDEITHLVNAPLLGTIPTMSKRESTTQRGQKVHLDSQSPAAEAFRTIRTAIFFSIPQDQAQIIQVTSSIAAEGKSLLVSNLAIAMAQSGQRILIIDADFRRPTQHKIFEMSQESGLSAVLANLQTPKEAILKTKIEGLHIMSCGPECPNPAEMLNSEGFNKLLKKLATYYHRIIVDSPPLAPVADASILAARCDATILLVRAEKARRKGLLYGCDTIRHVGGKIVGCVVNDVHRSGRYSYYYDYGHYSSNSNPRKRNSKKRHNVSQDHAALL
jgi:capsular exopolysaccharide synthesis family protein